MDISNPTVIGGLVVVALQAAVAYFLKSMASDFKEMIRQVNGQAVEIGVLKQQVATLKEEVQSCRDNLHDLKNELTSKFLREGR